MTVEPGKRYTTQLNGQTITVKMLESEQDINRDRRKVICINEATGRKIRRTPRQLHPIQDEQ